MANFARMDQWTICSGNPGKLAELEALLPEGVVAMTHVQRGFPADLPEDGETLEANALQKARTVQHRVGGIALADDSGLEVDALAGAPGVLSARFAGPAKDAAANMRKLLGALEGVGDRRARFRTVLAVIGPWGGQLFEGRVEGTITEAPQGVFGFGYDPVFRPQGHDRTFAEMDAAEKNAISHRAQAMARLKVWLHQRVPAV